jgi:hypothetical protein
MNAGFGWVDFSNDQRQKVFSVVDMLSESGSVDELGIGSIRDAIADWLFPGISTIQTRPKYFIILTDILLEYIKRYQKGEKVGLLSEYLRTEEHRIMHILAKNHNYRDGDGIIGVSVAQNNSELFRKPSSIYWNGLRVHRLIDTELSSNDYLKQNDLSKLSSEQMKGEDGEDDPVILNDYFGIKAPYFNCISEDMTMKLTKDQANFLRDQFKDVSHVLKKENNLLSQLLTPELAELMKNSKSFKEMANQLLVLPEIKHETKNILRLALEFDFIIHGAHIRYNIQLHRKSGKRDFSSEWLEWLELLNQKKLEIQRFDFDFLFREISPRTALTTQQFLRNWRDGVLEPELKIENLDELIRQQENNKKGSKAKLTSLDGEYTDWVGIRELNYRFGIVKNMVVDIEFPNA